MQRQKVKIVVGENKYAPAGLAGLVLAVGLALLVICLFFEKDFLLGTSSYWQLSTEDITQYFAGFNRYMDAPWQHPILFFNSINYPEGTTATFVDAIPLYALLLKIFVPKSFLPFNPYGAWVGLCFILQAVGAWWIARELRANSWMFLFSLTVLLLLSPTLMVRLGHISLMSHWILLFALALYLRGYRLSTLPVLGWTLLLVPTFYINIYLLAMASGIYLVSLLTVGFRHNYRVLFYFTTPYLLIFLSLFITLLPLPPGQITRDFGFGHYSMNLLSPFIGGHIFSLQANIADGQYEGYNYLGIGVILLFFVAIGCCYRYDRHVFKRHWALSALLVGYTLYALSNNIYFGENLILVLKYPSFLEGLTAQFRASGRFFWTAGYGIVIFSLFILHRHLKTRVFFMLVLALMTLQIFDLKERYTALKAIRQVDPVAHINYEQWDQKLGVDTNSLYFYPRFKCGKEAPQLTLLPTMKYAALRNYNMSTGYVARYTPHCDGIAEEISASNTHDSAYIFVKSEFDGMEQIKSFLPNAIPFKCDEIDFAYICLRSN